jgi:carbohydrate-selective porin OprB
MNMGTQTIVLLAVSLVISVAQPRVAVAQDASGDAPAPNETETQADATTPAGNGQGSSDSGQTKLTSLLDAEPAVLIGMMRYPKYYGDPNMARGDLLKRSHLLGDWGGARDDLAAHGLTVDFGVTQVFQGVVAGDSDRNTSYVGSADLWLGLDTGRAGLWSNGLLFAHGEGNWGDPLSGTGALLPLNGDAIAPGAPPSIALSEIYLTQALSPHVLLIAGKVNWAAWADTSFFANNERTQFLYEGLINNAVLAPFIPYTSWGAFLAANISKEHTVGFLFAQNAGSATVSGFNDFRIDEATFAAAYTYSPVFGDLPGLYEFVAGYTSKDFPNYAVSERYLLGEILGLLPTSTEEGNYAFIFTGSQYLWVKKGAQRKRSDPINYATARRDNMNPVGFGLVVRFGIVPSDRNVIDQFYSVGIGGWGGIPGRDDDNWGVGWAGAHISGDFREDTSALGFELEDFEHGVEAFYNFALTPAMHLSVHAQYVHPIEPTKDDIVTLGTRLQLDF